ncbi:DUF6585 family protein [Ktedonospora formicarum]|uniref:Uncharacterized protein n=1 Tax=Ktedonospora formicarum TaxID=2778364 RepID=A0A8J3I1R1_9CHLR|nr:DUF6585 family protein [Ktedonospora formicarum]GHO48422.1 hypothetical protein KSX_65850 [Ktedonospora formicarum]
MMDHISSASMNENQETSHLGMLVSQFGLRMSLPDKIFCWFTGAIGLIILGGLLFVVYAYFRDPYPLTFSSYIPLGVMAYLSFQSFILLCNHEALVTPFRRKITIYLYEKGFVYCEGCERRELLWSQVKSVERGAITMWFGVFPRYIVCPSSGKAVVLNSIIGDVVELGRAIERGVADHLWPEVLADFQAGKPFVLPGLAVSQRYASKSDIKLAWRLVEVVEADMERLVIKGKGSSGAWLWLPVSQLINLGILAKLLIYIKEEQGLDMRVEV